MTQTDFSTTIEYIPANFDDKFKESLRETIADQDTKIDTKSENQLHNLSIHTKEDSTKFSIKL